MPFIFAGGLDDMPTTMHRRLGVFRYDVFVGRLGWQLPGADATSLTEWDQFDRGRTIHVVSVDQAQHICGCARLIPTTQPYLLQTLCAPSAALDLPCAPRFGNCRGLPRAAGKSNHTRVNWHAAVSIDSRDCGVAGRDMRHWCHDTCRGTALPALRSGAPTRQHSRKCRPSSLPDRCNRT